MNNINRINEIILMNLSRLSMEKIYSMAILTSQNEETKTLQNWIHSLM